MKGKTLPEKVEEMFFQGHPAPTIQPAGEERDNKIKVGSTVWYTLPGKPEVGPCRVTSQGDGGWHLVENGDWTWVHLSLITKME